MAAPRWYPPIDESSAAVLREAVSRTQTFSDLGIKQLNYLGLHATCSTHGRVTIIRCEHEWESSDGMVICPHPDHILSGITRRMVPFAYSAASGPDD